MAEQRVLTSKTHAVLKLHLGEKGGTRRINFSRLWDVKSETVSYTKLVGLAVEYSFPEDAPHDLSEYEVLVTYLDEDGDSITISSDMELSEAFLQFVDGAPPVLRASAKVKRAVTDEDKAADAPTETTTTTTPKANEEEPTITPGDEHTGPSRQTSGNGVKETNEPPPLEVIARSLANLVASAVSFQPNGSTNNASNNNVAASTSTATSSEDKDTEEAEKFVKEVIDNISLATTQAAKAAATAAAVAAESAARSSSPATKQPSTDGFDPSFIHGHHTCDGCKQKPIVGIRYHATNQQDYDLCSSCYETKGNEGGTVYAPTELDRDRPHQSRWKAVFTKDSEDTSGATPTGTQKNDVDTAADDDTANLDRTFIHGRHTCDSCLTTPIIGYRYHALNLPDYDLCQRCVENYKGNDIKFKAVELDRDRPLQHRWQRRQIRRARQAQLSGHGFRHMCPANARKPCGEVTEVMDLALKEAIRRSLLEVSPKTPPATEEFTEEKAEKSDEATTEPAAPKAVEEPQTGSTTAPVSGSGWGNTFQDPPGTWKCPSCLSKNPPNASTKCLSCEVPKGDSEAVMGGNGTDASVPDASVPDDSVPDASVPDANVVAKETARSLMRSDCKADEAKEPKTPPKQKYPKKMCTPESAKSTFSEDAAGIGEAAEAIGATLDACAGAIDAIVSEFDKDAEEADAADLPNEVDSVSAMTSSIPSIDEGKPKEEKLEDKSMSNPVSDDKDCDDWEVVDEDTEALAKATEVVGSALFESGKQETASNSSVDSLPSSVPTISSSTPEASRWVSELKQLHILGVTDDIRSIDALERLEAANTGSSDPITVDDAINYLLSQNSSDDKE